MTRANSTPTRGRPRDLEKHAHIVECAGLLFLELGLDAVTVEGVARAAGVSKVTVYNHFGDKENLFAEVIRSRTSRMRRKLETLDTDSAEPGSGLIAFGRELLGFLSWPEVVAMERLLLGQGHRHPGLTGAYFEAGPRTMCTQLTAILERWAAAGRLRLDDAETAARQLVSLWKGMDHMEVVLGLRPSPDESEVAARVERGVALFLRAYSTDDTRSSTTKS